jgi:hypothetical protein
MDNRISLTYNFDSQEELQSFLIDINNSMYKQKKPKKENDMRGSGTAELHKRVKEYREANPEKSYRECLKSISKSNINENNNNIV